jgi:hypothetical protein
MRCGGWKSNDGVATYKQQWWQRGNNGTATTTGKHQSTNVQGQMSKVMELTSKTTEHELTNVRQQRGRTTMAGKRQGAVVEAEEGRVMCIFLHGELCGGGGIIPQP